MQVLSYMRGGYEGNIVNVEVDLRRGIPGIDIVGLPDNAVREAKQRVRVALRNSGFQVPKERILINLAPGGVRKEGPAFDLPIAGALLSAASQVKAGDGWRVLFIGELELSGAVRGVPGVLAAVSNAVDYGADYCFVPQENGAEARSAGGERVVTLSHLRELPALFTLLLHKRGLPQEKVSLLETRQSSIREFKNGEGLSKPDFADMVGQRRLKRASMVAAAGSHHLLLFGPPGVGKTMTGLRIAGLLPELSRQASLELSRIYSLAGILPRGLGLIRRPPLRVPHHGASREGMIGGGSYAEPGEISLAHRGVLFLDELSSFSVNILQALRGPLESGSVQIARRASHYWYPASFQLVAAMNPCPCGKMGLASGSCMCSPMEIHQYWKKIGGALMDRIEMRLPVDQQEAPLAQSGLRDRARQQKEQGERPLEGTRQMAEKVSAAVERQKRRFYPEVEKRNRDMNITELHKYCHLDEKERELYHENMRALGLSSRAGNSVLKIARTIADLDGEKSIGERHLDEAFFYRRYGEQDYYWRSV